MKPKFDGYAAQYDAWFMTNDNLFQSELRLFQKALGDISGKRVLSVGCGSGLFESMIDANGIEGIEPSRDMGAIAQKRGINVIAFGAIEDAELEEILELIQSDKYLRTADSKTAITQRLTECDQRLHAIIPSVSLEEKVVEPGNFCTLE